MLEALATSIGETPRGGWPWPEVASDPVSLALIYKEEEASVDAEPEGRTLTRRSPWPTPTTLNHTSQKAKTGRSTSGPSRGGPSFGLDDAVRMASKGEWPQPVAGPNSDGLWPTPVADGDRTTNYAQGGMSLGAAVRFPTPRAEDGESAGQHKGRGPDTLTAYTKAYPSTDTFPTPTVYDATGKGAPRLEQKEGSRHAVSLHHLAGTWASEEPHETFPTPTSSMVTVGDMEQARYAGNGGKRPSYEEANQAWDSSEPRETFPTPTAADALGGPGISSSRKGGPNLRTAVDIWPTPKARDYKGTDYSRDGERRHSGDDLATAVDKRESWPTPKSSDVRHGLPNRIGEGERRSNLNDAAVKWPTPMSADANGVGGAASRKDGRQSMLHHAVKAEGEEERTWPTPMAGPADVRDGGGHGGVKLATAATEDPEAPRGQLNPDWTEWLMGWPVGWTSLDPLPRVNLDAWDGGMDERTWWRAEPAGIPRIAVSIPKRVDRLKAIGNGQVPQCAAAAALALAEMFRQVDAITEAEVPEELDGLAFLGM